MKFETLKIHVKLIRILYFEEAVGIRELERRLNMKGKYTTIRNILKQWVEEGIVTEDKKDLLLLGGDRFEYSLTNKGIEFVKEMMSDQFLED